MISKINSILKQGEDLNTEFKELKIYSGQDSQLIEEDIFKAIIPSSEQVAEQVPSKLK